MTGYRLTEPSGRVLLISADTAEDAKARVEQELEKWAPYCERNWLNDSGDLISPEMKVKRYLDSLAYFMMLLGKSRDIETDYKRLIHAQKEIPASSRPSSIDNMLYASGGTTDKIAAEEEASFRVMLDELDERAARYAQKRKPAKRHESLFRKKERLGIHGGTWHRVDTEGKFWVGNEHYIIDDQALQYQPIETAYGDYYCMDRILKCGDKFYDMNYDEVRVYHIGGIF